MPFERVDVGGPKAPEGIEPGIDLHERFRPDPVDAPLCVYARLHTLHNLTYYHRLMDRIRRAIEAGAFAPFREGFLRSVEAEHAPE